MVWNECKRASGSAKEAEHQALDAAKRCIRKENLLWIYALTTVGVTFRVWKVSKDDQQLTSLDQNIDKYIDADSAHAWILRKAIQRMKDEIPLGDPGVVPSQSHLLGRPDPGEGGSSTVQGTQSWPVLSSMSGYAQGEQQETFAAIPLPPTFMAAGGFGEQLMPPSLAAGALANKSMEEVACRKTIDVDEAGASAAVANTGVQEAETWSKVDLHRISHLTKRDEYIFTTDRNHEKSTDRDEWKEIKHRGKRAWYYRYKGTYYYTRDRPGG